MEKKPLSCDEVVKAIKNKGPERVPMMIHFWNFPEAFGELKPSILKIQSAYPSDVFSTWLPMPGKWKGPEGNPEYRWAHKDQPVKDSSVAYDSDVVISDWAELDDLLAGFPSADTPGLFDECKRQCSEDESGRYRLGVYWFCFYERLWDLRGMENVMMDFYDHPDEVKKLLRALCDFYKTMIRRSAEELKLNGIFTSDDLGAQTGLMFSPSIFREFFKPLYEELFNECHKYGMHFWLHTCGNIKEILDDFIEIGLDVIHPIQKYTMDEREIAQKYAGKICFWAGMDVQQILPKGTPEDVRREVRFMIDTYDGPGGGLIMTAGNGITNDVPLANLEAFYDECYKYGAEHRRKWESKG